MYLLYRVSLFSDFRFHLFGKHNYFVIAQQMTKQIYRRPLERPLLLRTTNPLQPRYRDVVRQYTTHKKEGHSDTLFRKYWFVDSIRLWVFSYTPVECLSDECIMRTSSGKTNFCSALQMLNFRNKLENSWSTSSPKWNTTFGQFFILNGPELFSDRKDKLSRRQVLSR